MDNIAITSLKNIFISAILCITFSRDVFGFNINTENVFKQYEGVDGSYFGYALAFMDRNRLLIGAPKDNDPLIQNIVEPGRLFVCDVTSNRLCEPYSVDNKTGDDSYWNIHYTHGRNNAWLGATIDVPLSDNNQGIVVCSPRWHNRKYSGDYFMNGFCYVIPFDMNPVNIEKFPILVPLSMQTKKLSDRTIAMYAMAAMGLSIHYTDSNQDLLLGAPGLTDWTGGFVRKMPGQNFVVMDSSQDVSKTNSYYIGYSVTSGRYFPDKLEYYVLGAPRADLNGKVYMFLGGLDNYVLRNDSFELTARGNNNMELPMNSYFGGSLCTVDVNGDEYDDLLVGAPLYGNVSFTDEEKMHDTVDVGRVFLFLGNKEKDVFGKQAIEFSGDSIVRGRFGSAITSLGDINKDGFSDVAIGAPYENAMRGAVYIYNGYREGLWPMYSQKIVASQLDPGLRAFGHSISKPMDINSDSINDVAIGSYLSSHVTILLGQPVLNMAATMKVTDKSNADLKVIDKNSNTTYVQVCFRYEYRQCTRVTLSVNITLDIEKGDRSRVLFTVLQRNTLNMQLEVFSGDTSCSFSQLGKIYVKPTFDLVSPIGILVQYEMITNSCPVDSNPTISKFNGNSPGDPLLAMRKQLMIKNECPDNNCTTDLHLVTSATYENVDGYLVAGTSSLTLNINITKSGDPSYGSLFRMTMPNTLRYRKQEQTAGAEVVTCSLESGDLNSGFKKYENESMLECSLGNPLSDDSGVEFKLYFGVPGSISNNIIEFRTEVSTLSNELNPEDNSRNLNIRMKHHVKATLSGVSDPDTILIQERTNSYELEHVYEVWNEGPSTLPSADITISYPQIQKDGAATLFLNKTKIRCGRECELNCSMQKEISIPRVWTENNGRSYFANLASSGLTPLRYLNCDGGPCLTYSCALINLAPEQSASLSLEFIVLKGVEDILENHKSLEIVSSAKVHLNAPNLIADPVHLKHMLKTRLLPRVPRKTGIDWWIVLISVLVGLLLIALLIFILYKLKFFKRQRLPQAPPRKEIEKEKMSSDKEKESVSLTDSEHDIIDRKEKF